MSKPYLEDYEINRAKMCVSSIKDKLNAIETELNTRERPYKSYLNEKLTTILFDINCLVSMCEEGDNDEK